jgi:2-phosphosulfolactate phosphatase
MPSDIRTFGPTHRTFSQSKWGELVQHKRVSICCFEEGSIESVDNPALVAVDVIRATTTAVTAISMGRECHLAPTLRAAFDKASRLSNALLAGELGGDMPPGFDITNSPAELAIRSDVSRPLVLLSSTGTRLMYEIRCSDSAYLACFRNYSATIDCLVKNHDAVTLIGAGTRGEFREEDQMCCAWIAEGLIESGFAPGDELTLQLVERWRAASRDAFLTSRSVAYLQRSGQLHDLDFILDHFDDVETAGKVMPNEVTALAVATEV